ncbi:hypothetical protein GPECTOR_21g638 [Gonium pectorale]|uniref:Guanylate cyclase domain-containing protein n=1 Tax=Gonium pectorale TaxID=33097 RepID=A0A150GHT3_GONPE|nr:hypothetical protein GPECTOR_21g638 [Gonium pectorale]|eukprot:KXZ49412.1 hypothetical protein GPECTOR_21g638 [Gonium pectorale]
MYSSIAGHGPDDGLAMAVRRNSEDGGEGSEGVLIFTTEQGSTAMGCVLANKAAVQALQLRDEQQDMLNFLARSFSKDPGLKVLFQDLVKRLLQGQLSTVRHFVPGDFGKDRYFLSMRITPFAYRRESTDGGFDPTASPSPLSTQVDPAAAANDGCGGGSITPAMILELDMPYEGKELAARLQRDYMIISHIPSMVTMFDRAGRVLHQNRSSVAYMGYLVGADEDWPPTHGSAAGGPEQPRGQGHEVDAAATVQPVGLAGAGAGAGAGGAGRSTASPKPDWQAGVWASTGAGAGAGTGASPRAAPGSGHGARPNRLQLLFMQDPPKLVEVIRAVAEGTEWRGLVKMPGKALWGAAELAEPPSEVAAAVAAACGASPLPSGVSQCDTSGPMCPLPSPISLSQPAEPRRVAAQLLRELQATVMAPSVPASGAAAAAAQRRRSSAYGGFKASSVAGAGDGPGDINGDGTGPYTGRKTGGGSDGGDSGGGMGLVDDDDDEEGMLGPRASFSAHHGSDFASANLSVELMPHEMRPGSVLAWGRGSSSLGRASTFSPLQAAPTLSYIDEEGDHNEGAEELSFLLPKQRPQTRIGSESGGAPGGSLLGGPSGKRGAARPPGLYTVTTTTSSSGAVAHSSSTFIDTPSPYPPSLAHPDTPRRGRASASAQVVTGAPQSRSCSGSLPGQGQSQEREQDRPSGDSPPAFARVSAPLVPLPGPPSLAPATAPGHGAGHSQPAVCVRSHSSNLPSNTNVMAGSGAGSAAVSRTRLVHAHSTPSSRTTTYLQHTSQDHGRRLHSVLRALVHTANSSGAAPSSSATVASASLAAAAGAATAAAAALGYSAAGNSQSFANSAAANSAGRGGGSGVPNWSDGQLRHVQTLAGGRNSASSAAGRSTADQVVSGPLGRQLAGGGGSSAACGGGVGFLAPAAGSLPLRPLRLRSGALVDPDLDCRWHEVIVKPCFDPMNSQPLVMVIQTDVTSKVRAEVELAQVLEAEHRLLADIFPRHVVAQMTQRRKDEAQLERHGLMMLKSIQDPATLATSHESVTVLFADIKGFTEMSKEVSAAVVMTFLNNLYTRFDSLTDVYGVYKVETIGDCYMVAGGLVARDGDGYGRAVRGEGNIDPMAPQRVVAFARAMLEEAAKVALPNTGEPVKVRVGIHSGPVVSGVVGTKMPRFCLFGDTINTASRMESTGRPGAVHISATTRGLLPPEEEDQGWVPTGGVEVKGKGRMDTFMWCPQTPDAGRQRRDKQRQAMLLGTLSTLLPASSSVSPPASGWGRRTGGPPSGSVPAAAGRAATSSTFDATTTML